MYRILTTTKQKISIKLMTEKRTRCKNPVPIFLHLVQGLLTGWCQGVAIVVPQQCYILCCPRPHQPPNNGAKPHQEYTVGIIWENRLTQDNGREKIVSNPPIHISAHLPTQAGPLLKPHMERTVK